MSWLRSAAVDSVRGRLPARHSGYLPAMWILLLILLLVLLVGVVGAIKLTIWALLVALLVVVVAGFLGRAAFSRAP